MRLFLFAVPVAILLAGCGGSSASQADNAGFLQEIRGSGNTILGNSTDDALFSFGNILCEAAGKPDADAVALKTEIVKLTLASGGDDASTSVVAGSAFSKLCPQFADLYNESLSAEAGELAPGISATDLKEAVERVVNEIGIDSACTLLRNPLYAWASAGDGVGSEEDWARLYKEWADATC